MTLLLLLDADDLTGFVVTFPAVRPRARFDYAKWTKVTIEESPSKDGPWTTLVTADLNPLDEDPAEPAERDITLRGAQLESGWYRITFLDGIGLRSPVRPIYNGDSWAPLVSDIALLMRTRTVGDVSGGLGGDTQLTNQTTFTDTTRPTAAEVRSLIRTATGDVVGQIAGPLPLETQAEALRNAVKYYTAVLIEKSFFGGDSVAWQAMLDAALAALNTNDATSSTRCYLA